MYSISPRCSRNPLVHRQQLVDARQQGVSLGAGHKPAPAIDDGDVPDLAMLKRELHGLQLL
jgi:hypothetical protein